MLHNIDEQRQIAAVRVGDWKLVKGTTYEGAWDSWYGPSGRGNRKYDLKSLRSSSTGIALTSLGRNLPSDTKIRSLRSEASVECKKPSHATICVATQQVCLFNIAQDPCELDNLVFKYPDIVRMLESTLRLFNTTAVPPGNKPIDPRADPKFWDYTWTNWCDLVEGGCPAAEGDDDHLIEEARILWDPELQERIREEILLQQQLPEIYVSK